MIRESRADRVFTFVNGAAMVTVLVAVLYPLIYIVSASISSPAEVYSGRMWLLPRGLTGDGFARVFHNSEIWVGYRNTLLYTVTGTTINVALTLTCAFALSRRDLPGRNAFIFLFAFTMFFSGGLIPTYLLVRNLGLRNTIWAMVLPNAVSVWFIVIARTFIESTIPEELYESASMDGCSNSRFFLAITLPLSTTLLAVLSLFYAVGHWNSFFDALIYLSRRSMLPLQLFLREILIQNQVVTLMSSENVETMVQQMRIADIIKYAVMIVSIVPLLVAYPFLQRYFVKGVMIGALKG